MSLSCLIAAAKQESSQPKYAFVLLVTCMSSRAYNGWTFLLPFLCAQLQLRGVYSKVFNYSTSPSLFLDIQLQ